MRARNCNSVNETWPAQGKPDRKRVEAVMNKLFLSATHSTTQEQRYAANDLHTNHTLPLILSSTIADNQPTLISNQIKYNGYIHWRARAIIKEIQSITSPVAFVEYENELREWIISQESRLRTKIIRCATEEEYMQYEREILSEHEYNERAIIERDMCVNVSFPMLIMTLTLEEIKAREEISYYAREQWQTHICTKFMRAVTQARAIHEKCCIQAIEALCWSEMRLRRLTEVGHELQLELIKVKCDYSLKQLNKFALEMIHCSNVLCAREERDRHAITELSLLHLNVLYNEANNLLPLVISDAIESVHAQRYCLESIAERTVTELEQRKAELIDREVRLRLMIEEMESAEMMTLHNTFIIGWRSVYHEITSNVDVGDVIILCHLELFERRQICDLQRQEFHNNIWTRYTSCHRLFMRHIKERAALMDEYEVGLHVLLQEEHNDFSILHRQYHFYLAETRVIARERVLVYEEQNNRYEIFGAMLLESYQLRHAALLERCYIHAEEGAAHITHAERVERESIKQAHWYKVLIEPMLTIMNEETQTRSACEHEECDCALGIVNQFRYLYCYGALCTDVGSVIYKEAETRSSLMHFEEHEIRVLECVKFGDYESAARQSFMRGELLMRCILEWKNLLVIETITRRECITYNEEQVRLAVNLQQVTEHETLERDALTQDEAEIRITLSSQCVNFDQRLLEACSHDEYTSRLDLLLEAQLEFNACVKRFDSACCDCILVRHISENAYDNTVYLIGKSQYDTTNNSNNIKSNINSNNKCNKKKCPYIRCNEHNNVEVNTLETKNDNEVKFAIADTKSCLSLELQAYIQELQETLEPMARGRVCASEEVEFAIFYLEERENYNRAMIVLLEWEQWLLCVDVSIRILTRQTRYETWCKNEHDVSAEICNLEKDDDTRTELERFLADSNKKMESCTCTDASRNDVVITTNIVNHNINAASEVAYHKYMPVQLLQLQDAWHRLLADFYWTRDALIFDESIIWTSLKQKNNESIYFNANIITPTTSWKIDSIFLPVDEYDGSIEKLKLRFWYAEREDVQYEMNLTKTLTTPHFISVIGKEMRVLEPCEPTIINQMHDNEEEAKWNTQKNYETKQINNTNVEFRRHLCMMLFDADINLVASATVVLPEGSSEENNSDIESIHVISVPLDNSHGRFRLARSCILAMESILTLK